MFEKTRAALAQLNSRQHPGKEYNFAMTKVAEAYAEEVGIPFIEAWHLRDKIAELVK